MKRNLGLLRSIKAAGLVMAIALTSQTALSQSTCEDVFSGPAKPTTESLVAGAIRIFAFKKRTMDMISAFLIFPQILNDSEPQAKVFNNEMLKTLETPIARRSKNRIGFATRAQAKAILDSVMANPVASLDNYSTYDPEDKGIGFCFGRAMASHIEALTYGVEKDKIKKLWAIGNLKAPNDPRGWSYHVTTAIQGTNGVWWTIDPIMGRVMPATEWYEEMRKLNPDGRMHLFVSSPKMFVPTGVLQYNKNDLHVANWNSYFADLLKGFRDEAAQVAAEAKAQHQDAVN